MANKNRMARIDAQIQRNVSEIINTKLNDPRISGVVSVMDVKTTPDLKHAKVFLSVYGEEKEETLSAIRSAQSFIRRGLAQSLNLRIVPELSFVLDTTQEYSEKINKILSNLNIPSNDEEENN